MINFNDIHKITKRKELIQLIRTERFIKVLTDGNTVYAWKYKYNLDNPNADEIAVRTMLPKLIKDYTCYMIDEQGRLLHTIKINYSVMKKFVNRWFPDCYHAKHIKDYDKHNGLPLFQTLSPAEDYIHRCRKLKIITMAQINEKQKGKFVLFTEDNEMCDKPPHTHVCVNTDNLQYIGLPLRDINWADKYKSIFTVRLINPEFEEQTYTAENLVVEEEAEKGCYANMQQKDRAEIVRILNRDRLKLWIHYEEANKES